MKELAWNHDSKRQIYLASDVSPFSRFPNELEYSPPLHPSIKATKKKKKDSGSDRIFGHLEFYWISPELNCDQASEAKLIFYPQYPETRFSGFLRGTSTVPSEYLREKSGEKYDNRLLFLGTDRASKTYGFLAVGHDDLRVQIRNEAGYDENVGINRLELESTTTAEQRLLLALKKIYLGGWHNGIRLKNGIQVPCTAPQAVGFTLEALLGISPNSDNAPDFEGYEVKAVTVTRSGWDLSKAVTLMTPEPTHGVYCNSINKFLEEYGYADRKGRSNRQNFGGVHRVGTRHQLTGLLLRLVGYSPARPNQMDLGGSLSLVDDRLEAAAAWSFAKLIDTWKKKHELAVYIQAQKRKNPTVQFQYLEDVRICKGADFFNLLRCLAGGLVYLDPAIKSEGWQSGNAKIKKRNQFRIAMRSIPELYQTSKVVSLA